MRYGFIFAVGLFVSLTSGCFFHAGYPYGNNGYYAPGPGVVPQQPMNGPAYPMYQPGVPAYPAPVNGGNPYTPGTSPGGTGPTPLFTPSTPGSTPSTYDNGTPGSNNNTPSFDPQNPSGGKVPLPGDDDPNFGRGGTTMRPGLTPTTSSNDTEDITPFTQKESRRSRRAITDQGESLVEEEDRFQRPVLQTSSTENGEVNFANNSTNSTPKPYAHDPQFAWVQGTVEYDKPSQTWAIIYDDNPAASDPRGGCLILADDPQLARLRTGDAVRFYGSLDDSFVDSRNQPIFRMTRFKRL